MPDAVLKALDGYVAQLTLVQRAIDGIYTFVGKGDLMTVDWSTARSAAPAGSLHRHRHLGGGVRRRSPDRLHAETWC